MADIQSLMEYASDKKARKGNMVAGLPYLESYRSILIKEGLRFFYAVSLMQRDTLTISLGLKG